MSTLIKSIAACVMSIAATAACAVPMTYTFSGKGSGMLGNETFTDSQFSFVGTADSKDVIHSEDGYTVEFTGVTFATEGGLSAEIGGLVGGSGAFEIYPALVLGRNGDFESGLFVVLWEGDHLYDYSGRYTTPESTSGGALIPIKWESSAGLLAIDAGPSQNARFSASVASAVPEPESYAMMLAGLGVMGTVARRRKAAQRGLVAQA